MYYTTSYPQPTKNKISRPIKYSSGGSELSFHSDPFSPWLFVSNTPPPKPCRPFQTRMSHAAIKSQWGPVTKAF